MKKKMIQRFFRGIPIGVTIGYLIAILISLGWGNGNYLPCAPELIRFTGSEIRAVVLQTVLSGILGAGFSASSIIWEMDSWSIVKQTGIYFAIVSAIMLPVAYLTYWMEHSIIGFFSYFGIFIVIFVIIWIIMFLIGRYNVEKMNEKLFQTRKRKNEQEDHEAGTF
ncbi:MAG: DUF3021 domain-containing protein [Peptoniphilaceae bacterium]|nr:DUF3021 domain-containing protein [Peptoniphilaceae bacterium]MCI6660385.1 DUF3021 domain-containing protein [Peptoniphilaceae bacterium]MDD7542912.1 DUF3021 domain-containing protein [Peptoniphilaceae bacterium]MDY4196713.1 DUF3021 domain-containing protein [Peptoniphilaceae bacterium]MDY5766386.1 DUF3021 domain-containing protein [Peptoniphilaceae bacterium]